MDQILAEIKSYEDLANKLENFTDEPRWEAMIPLTNLAFFRGQILHTNTITVRHSASIPSNSSDGQEEIDEWFVEYSAKQARELAKRRLDNLRKKLENMKKLEDIDVDELELDPRDNSIVKETIGDIQSPMTTPTNTTTSTATSLPSPSSSSSICEPVPQPLDVKVEASVDSKPQTTIPLMDAESLSKVEELLKKLGIDDNEKGEAKQAETLNEEGLPFVDIREVEPVSIPTSKPKVASISKPSLATKQATVSTGSAGKGVLAPALAQLLDQLEEEEEVEMEREKQGEKGKKQLLKKVEEIRRKANGDDDEGEGERKSPSKSSLKNHIKNGSSSGTSTPQEREEGKEKKRVTFDLPESHVEDGEKKAKKVKRQAIQLGWYEDGKKEDLDTGLETKEEKKVDGEATKPSNNGVNGTKGKEKGWFDPKRIFKDQKKSPSNQPSSTVTKSSSPSSSQLPTPSPTIKEEAQAYASNSNPKSILKPTSATPVSTTETPKPSNRPILGDVVERPVTLTPKLPDSKGKGKSKKPSRFSQEQKKKEAEVPSSSSSKAVENQIASTSEIGDFERRSRELDDSWKEFRDTYGLGEEVDVEELGRVKIVKGKERKEENDILEELPTSKHDKEQNSKSSNSTPSKPSSSVDEDDDASSTFSYSDDSYSDGSDEGISLESALEARQLFLKYYSQKHLIGAGANTGFAGGNQDKPSIGESEWVPDDYSLSKEPHKRNSSNGMSRFRGGNLAVEANRLPGMIIPLLQESAQMRGKGGDGEIEVDDGLNDEEREEVRRKLDAIREGREWEEVERALVEAVEENKEEKGESRMFPTPGRGERGGDEGLVIVSSKGKEKVEKKEKEKVIEENVEKKPAMKDIIEIGPKKKLSVGENLEPKPPGNGTGGKAKTSRFRANRTGGEGTLGELKGLN